MRSEWKESRQMRCKEKSREWKESRQIDEKRRAGNGRKAGR